MTRFISLFKYLIFSVLFMLFIYAVPQKKSITNTTETQAFYLIDTSRSYINWQNYHKGNLKFKDGYVQLSQQEINDAQFTIAMNKIHDLDIDNKLLKGTLENVLKSADFFNVGVFPEAKFELHAIQKTKKDNYRFTGDFILFRNGICHNFTGNVRYKKDSLYLDTDYIHIDRTDWGIYYLSAKNPNPKDEEESYVVGDTIRIDVHIACYKKE